MGRLTAAIVLLIITLLGWRVASSPVFQRNAALPFFQQRDVSSPDGIPQPRSTGFSTEIAPTSQTLNPTPAPTGTTPLPPIQPNQPNKGQRW